jgi:hypothetical protein
MKRGDYAALDAAIMAVCTRPMRHSLIQHNTDVRAAAQALRSKAATTRPWYPLISRRLQALRKAGKLTNNMVSGDGCEWYPPKEKA